MNKSETEAPSRNKNKNWDFGRFWGGLGGAWDALLRRTRKSSGFRFSVIRGQKQPRRPPRLRGEIVFLFLLSSFGDGPRGRSHSYFITVDKKCDLSGI